MSTITRKQLIDQLNWRYATKQFDSTRKISAEDWNTLEEALVLSPSSLGLQPWKFLVIEDPELRAKLQPASYGQPQILDASHLVVLTTRFDLSESDVDAHVANVAKVRGVAVEDLAGLKAMAMGIVTGRSETERREWAFNQTYIALGNLLTSAALLGIDACPMEGFSREEYDKILGLTELGLASTAVATLGYRSAGDKYATAPKVRFERKEIVSHL